MLPVQPAGPAISLELDVDDGEVENYEVCLFLWEFFSCWSQTQTFYKYIYLYKYIFLSFFRLS